MSEHIKHECGIGLIRLKKPLSFYQDKYGSSLWGLSRLRLLMEKQRNRGQHGAGLASIKLRVPGGQPYLDYKRSNKGGPWSVLFDEIRDELAELNRKYPKIEQDEALLQKHFGFSGELLMGHLRYSTHGSNQIESCHPVVRHNNWRSRTLAVAGNFNLTNVRELFDRLIELGQHPKYFSDTETVLERIGHFLDEEVDEMVLKYKERSKTKKEISDLIADRLDTRKIIQRAARRWDGGYVMGGLIGCGIGWVARDPNGIRPCYYYENDEIVVAASERPPLATTFNIPLDEIKELPPGNLLVIERDGTASVKAFTEPKAKASCSFERIYFSRANDPEIYQERLELGRQLVPKVLETIHYDLDHTVFGYIPNSAEIAFWGMMKGVETYMNNEKIRKIRELNGKATDEELKTILSARPRVEKVIWKDNKLRTFIADDESRDDMVAHGYDITQGAIESGVDTLVCIDDSIVRGTTLQKSILNNLSRLKPKKIIIVSSAPQIRFPDCYGIDMSQIEKFVAFRAAVALLRERSLHHVANKVEQEIRAMADNDMLYTRNAVKAIYEPFTEDEISRKIGELLTPKNLGCKVEIIYQPLANLEVAIPNHRGDWYFSGDYPTPGGNRVVNNSYLNYLKGSLERAY